MPDFAIKRVYEAPAVGDGTRVLVDRVWPRGVSKHDARIDAWMKDIAPSTGLRQWFGHDPAKWAEFCKRYAQELKDKRELASKLRTMANERRVTLLFAAKDTEHNNAVALKAYLENMD